MRARVRARARARLRLRLGLGLGLGLELGLRLRLGLEEAGAGAGAGGGRLVDLVRLSQDEMARVGALVVGAHVKGDALRPEVAVELRVLRRLAF